MSAPQKSIRKKPGKYSSIFTFIRQTGVDDIKIKLAAASLMDFIETSDEIPSNLDILVSVNPSLIDYPSKINVLPKTEHDKTMPSTQADILINISGETTTDILFASRLCKAAFKDLLAIQEMIHGGKIRYGQEPFGFYHPENTGREDHDKIAIIQGGELEGGSWILMQRYEQKIDDFFGRPISERVDIMGGKPVGYDNVDEPIPPTAHTQASQAGSPTPLMVRRGFAYNEQAIEGTVFIGLSQSTDYFTQTLNAMLQRDSLMNFANALSGGIYYAPPDAKALFADAPKMGLPETLRPLAFLNEDDTQAIPLVDYTVVKPFLDYIDQLREGGLFDGAVGHMTFNKEVATLLTAINQVLSGGELKTAPEVKGFDEKEAAAKGKTMNDALEGANLLNLKTGYYMTVG